MISSLCAVFLLMAAQPPESTMAQTQEKDRSLSMAQLDQLKPSIARPSRQDDFVAVWECEQSAATGADIYIQLVDSNWAFRNLSGASSSLIPARPTGRRESLGIRIFIAHPAWPVNGVPVCHGWRLHYLDRLSQRSGRAPRTTSTIRGLATSMS
jgi:hypothetical protein